MSETEAQTTKKRTKKDDYIVQGSILAAAAVLTKIIGVVYRIPLTNILGDEGNGFYGYAYQVYAIALMISSFSLPTAVSKLVSIRLAKRQRRNAFRVFICSLAFAIGVGLFISHTADIAVISLGGTVVNTSIKVAGDDFDEAIVRYMRKKHNLLIGERTAEDIKIKIGTTYPLVEEETMEVRGRNLVTGLPKTVTVTSSETEEALREATGQIVEAVIAVLEQTPPELSADILDRGIVLTGGGSMLRGLEELIEERTGINTMTAEDPMKVVAIGTGQFVEFMSGRGEV